MVSQCGSGAGTGHALLTGLVTFKNAISTPPVLAHCTYDCLQPPLKLNAVWDLGIQAILEKCTYNRKSHLVVIIAPRVFDEMAPRFVMTARNKG